MSAESQTVSCKFFCLSEDDVPKLMESLKDVRNKWEEIGLALGLGKQTCIDCSSRNNFLSLNNILTEWVNGNRPKEDTTLNKLKLALESPGVERGRVAQNIVERFTMAKKALAAKRPLAAKTPVAAKNQQLVHLYSVHKEIPEDSWPPAPRDATFINLLLLNMNERQTGDYYFTIRGGMDDIMARKEKIEYNKVFGQYKAGALILIEGRPGSGKTTLVHKVTRDWATTGKVLCNANWVFLIPLRSLAKGSDESLIDILAIFYLDREDCKEVFSEIKRSNGDGVCFIIDGLDEYKPQNESTSVIYGLLQKRYLPKAMVIVASRPMATSKRLQNAQVNKQIEVVGFTQQQIFEYIGKFPFPQKSYVSNLIAYLKSHRNILHMCYLPVHASMICYLYQEKGDIPSRETKIYEEFTRHIVLRKLTRSNEYAQLHSLDDLGGRDKEYFRKVCNLANDMTLHCKQVVHKGDTQVSLNCEPGSNDDPSLGLITIDITAQQYGWGDTYTFLHLTFQEYLTAVYLATLDEEQQMEIIRMHGGEPHMRNVWKFYMAMVAFEGKVAQIHQIMSYADDPIYRVQCAFESQQAVVCDHAIRLEAGVLSFSWSTLTAADMSAMGYAITTTSQSVTKLAITHCMLHADHVRVFLREVSQNKLKCIQALDLGANNIGDDGASVLAEALKSCNNLQALDLRGNSIGSDCAAALAEALTSCNNLQELKLFGNNIGADGAAALTEGLKCCNHLQELNLTDNNIGADGAEVLADALKWSNLQALDLEGNSIGADGVAALAAAMKSCNLQALYLGDNNIGADGVAALAEALKSGNNLQALSLGYNNIGDDGATTLAKALKSCNLQTLYLGHNNIGADGVAALAEALKSCNNLQALSLGYNNIAKGVAVLAKALRCYSNLQKLNLGYNNIGADGVATLAEALKLCNHLQVLELGGNNAGDYGAAALAQALKSCNNLQELYLEHNNIGAEGRAALADLKGQISTLLY